MNRLHIYNDKRQTKTNKKTSTINYIVYDSINMKFKNKQNWSLVICHKTGYPWYMQILTRKEWTVVIWCVENVCYLSMGGSYKCVCLCAYKNSSRYILKISVLYKISTSVLKWIEARLYLFSVSLLAWSICIEIGLGVKWKYNPPVQIVLRISWWQEQNIKPSVGIF